MHIDFTRHAWQHIESDLTDYAGCCVDRRMDPLGIFGDRIPDRSIEDLSSLIFGFGVPGSGGTFLIFRKKC